MKKETIEILVEGGKATGGPPLGPQIGPLGVNINDVVNAINEKTANLSGMKIPVKVIVDPETKKFEIEVGSPTTSALIKKELGLEKGSQNGSPVGDLSFDQLMKIMEMKKNSLLANDLKGAAKEIIGTCKSLGVTIEGKDAKEITAEIDSGGFDDRFGK
jgi:large subunit ribosomal protein L11